MNILLLDDDPFALKLLARQLEYLGFAPPLRCERAQDALARLEAGPDAIDLVFCDLQMPGMDGVEFLRKLVDIGYAGALVLVSGENLRILETAGKLARGHHLNVLGTLHKPISAAALRQVLERTAAHGDVAPPAEHKRHEPDALRHAIAAGQLFNHYQPKVRLSNGALVGVEALARWRHPTDGVVYPDQFVPVAEDHGLIDALTRTVLGTALDDARGWHDAGLPIQVAVNVSMINLSSLEFPEFVVRETHRAGVPAASLMLEITESRLMADPLAPLDILTRLRLKNIGVAIDDFGTGHSSLAQLRDIPFNELKLDRGFVHGACSDASLQAILEASVGVARQFGMQTVAEGVSDLDDWRFLRALGADQAQGNFIAPPMAASMLLRWAAEWERRRDELGGESASATHIR